MSCLPRVGQFHIQTPNKNIWSGHSDRPRGLAAQDKMSTADADELKNLVADLRTGEAVLVAAVAAVAAAILVL